MKVPVVMSESKQEFMGKCYYLSGYYFNRNGKKLHREVWRENFGDIPEGYHVHHIDGNRANNDPSNLALLTKEAHGRLHGLEKPRELQMKAIHAAQAKAPEWHRSKEGLEWHRENGKRVWDNTVETERVCPYCGNRFMSRDKAHGDKVFCNQNCKAADRRARIKATGQKILGYKGHVPTWDELQEQSFVDNKTS